MKTSRTKKGKTNMVGDGINWKPIRKTKKIMNSKPIMIRAVNEEDTGKIICGTLIEETIPPRLSMLSTPIDVALAYI